MDSQSVINVLIGLVAFFGGIWVKSLSDSMKELKVTDSELADKVHEIEKLVAGQYVTRTDFDKKIDKLFEKLDHIAAAVDRKQDRTQ